VVKLKKIILGLLIFILCLISVNAYENVFKLDEDINYKFPCIINNSLCAPSINCNVTIFDSKMNTLVNGMLASKQGTFYNYSLSSGLLNNSGRYNVILFCGNLITNYTSLDYFYITPSGYEDSSAQSAIYIAFIIILLIGGVLIFMWAYSLESSNYTFGDTLNINMDKYLKMALYCFDYIIFIIFIFVLTRISEEFVFLNLSGIFNKFLMILLIGVTPLVLLITIIVGIKAIMQDFKIIKDTTRMGGKVR